MDNHPGMGPDVLKERGKPNNRRFRWVRLMFQILLSLMVVGVGLTAGPYFKKTGPKPKK